MKSKNKLRVGLVITKPYIYKKSFISSKNKKKYKYYGMIYEIWSKIKSINNWNNRVIEKEYEPDYDNCIKAIVDNKVDIIVGNIWIFERRIKLAHFTRPIFLSKIKIVYKPKKSLIQTYFNVSYKSYIKPLLIILIIGIFFMGYYLNLF